MHTAENDPLDEASIAAIATEGHESAPEPEPSAESGEGNLEPLESAELGEEPEDRGEEETGTTSLGPGEELTDEELVREIAALLFASVEPMTLGKLTSLLLRPRRGRVKEALATLGTRLEAANLPFQVRPIKGGFALMTLPEMGPVVERLLSGSTVERVSAAALETLAVIAYRQPVTKAEIEAIRGVQAGPILRSLVDRGLIKVAGRADVPGSPLQYSTTKDFLDRFGLQAVDDLPRDAELAQD